MDRCAVKPLANCVNQLILNTINEAEKVLLSLPVVGDNVEVGMCSSSTNIPTNKFARDVSADDDQRYSKKQACEDRNTQYLQAKSPRRGYEPNQVQRGYVTKGPDRDGDASSRQRCVPPPDPQLGYPPQDQRRGYSAQDPSRGCPSQEQQRDCPTQQRGYSNNDQRQGYPPNCPEGGNNQQRGCDMPDRSRDYPPEEQQRGYTQKCPDGSNRQQLCNPQEPPRGNSVQDGQRGCPSQEQRCPTQQRGFANNDQQRGSSTKCPDGGNGRPQDRERNHLRSDYGMEWMQRRPTQDQQRGNPAKCPEGGNERRQDREANSQRRDCGMDGQRCPPQDQQRCPPQDQQRCPPQDQQRCPPQDQQRCPPQDQQHCPPQDQQRCSTQDQTRSYPPNDQQRGCPTKRSESGFSNQSQDREANQQRGCTMKDQRASNDQQRENGSNGPQRDCAEQRACETKCPEGGYDPKDPDCKLTPSMRTSSSVSSKSTRKAKAEIVPGSVLVTPLNDMVGVVIDLCVRVETNITQEKKTIDMRLECPQFTPRRICVNGVWKKIC